MSRLRHLSVRRYSRILWSVQTKNVCSAPSLLQRHLNCKELPITNVIVPLSGVEVMRKESAGVQLMVLGRTLGQNGPHSNIGGQPPP